MSDQDNTPRNSKQGNKGTAPKGSAHKAGTSKSSVSNNSTSSGNKNSKSGVNLTPVESLLFFNIVRFNNDPSNVDWDQVAQHSNLKNASSAKVRFRQIQKKYGLEPAPTGRQKRKSHDVAMATEEEDEAGDADEHDVDSDDTPAKKRPRKRGTRGTASQKEVVAKVESDNEGTALAVPASDGPVPSPAVAPQHGQSEQEAQGHKDSVIKQEPPVRQVQMNAVSPAPLNSPAPQQQQQQQQRVQGQLSSQYSANAVPYDMRINPRAGTDMRQGMFGFNRTSGMANPSGDHGMTQQQQAYLQNLFQQHQNHVYGSQWNFSVPQGAAQDRMMQPGGSQYGQHGGLSYHTQVPQGYFGAQGQTGNQAINQALTQSPAYAPAQVPTTAQVRARAPVQVPAISNNSLASSPGNGSNTGAPGSPVEPLFGGLLDKPGSATSPVDTTAKPAGQSETTPGEKEKAKEEKVHEAKMETD